ncbi:terminase small subunit [Paenibacillus polymyxa]|uniref:terminase small subunit n=1 Tax=Paenibacillus polymyxa TaxID=1406 RepID=UPI001F285B09|nr:terminase small subunit [Paenibacillus polymyxa]
MEYMKIAFADITDYVEFGQKEEDVLGLEGDPAFDPDTGETKKYRYQHWTGHFNPEPTWSATGMAKGDTSEQVADFNPRTHMECDSENAVIHTLMISIPHIIIKTDAKKAWINA